jgi:hypothetical protein
LTDGYFFDISFFSRRRWPMPENISFFSRRRRPMMKNIYFSPVGVGR